MTERKARIFIRQLSTKLNEEDLDILNKDEFTQALSESITNLRNGKLRQYLLANFETQQNRLWRLVKINQKKRPSDNDAVSLAPPAENLPNSEEERTSSRQPDVYKKPHKTTTSSTASSIMCDIILRIPFNEIRRRMSKKSRGHQLNILRELLKSYTVDEINGDDFMSWLSDLQDPGLPDLISLKWITYDLFTISLFCSSQKLNWILALFYCEIVDRVDACLEAEDQLCANDLIHLVSFVLREARTHSFPMLPTSEDAQSVRRVYYHTISEIITIYIDLKLLIFRKETLPSVAVCNDILTAMSTLFDSSPDSMLQAYTYFISHYRKIGYADLQDASVLCPIFSKMAQPFVRVKPNCDAYVRLMYLKFALHDVEGVKNVTQILAKIAAPTGLRWWLDEKGASLLQLLPEGYTGISLTHYILEQASNRGSKHRLADALLKVCKELQPSTIELHKGCSEMEVVSHSPEHGNENENLFELDTVGKKTTLTQTQDRETADVSSSEDESDSSSVVVLKECITSLIDEMEVEEVGEEGETQTEMSPPSVPRTRAKAAASIKMKIGAVRR